MRTVRRLLCLAILLAVIRPSGAATYYVATGGVDGANDGLSWGAAFRTISNAVEKASDSDEVVVSNGTYVLAANIVVTKAITITGTNGAALTVLDGSNTVRCLVISNSAAVVQGFTLTRGKAASADYHATRKLGGGVLMFKGTVQNCALLNNVAQDGAGAYIMSGALLRNCRIEGNNASGGYGGGVCNFAHAGGIVDGCLIISNSSVNGGVDLRAGGLILNSVSAFNTNGGLTLTVSTARCCLVYGNVSGSQAGGVVLGGASALESCTVAGNNTTLTGAGAGVDASSTAIVKNSIIRFNRGYAGDYSFAAGASVTYSCVFPLVAGAGNTSADPLFLNTGLNEYRLSMASPALNRGTNLAWMAAGSDVAGNPRISPASTGTNDMGCYEMPLGALACTPEADVVNGASPLQAVLTAAVAGPVQSGLYYKWSFTNGAVVDAEGFDKRVVTNVFPAGVWSITLTVTNDAGETAALTRTNWIKAGPANLYVAKGGANTAAYPYDTWAKAASNIQAAVDAGALGSTVWVSNGVYTLAQPITVKEGLTVKAFGPGVTAVNGAGVVPCFIVDHTNAVLDGLVITNGYGTGYWGYGAGVRVRAGTVQNCLIARNSGFRGGGVALFYQGVLRNCVIASNTASSYGCGIDSRDDGTWGGGVAGNIMAGGRIENCAIIGNSGGNGGAVETIKSTLRNCLIAGNSQPSPNAGGISAVDCTLENCTIAMNNMANAGATAAGGLYGDANTKLYNTILWGNTSASTNKDYYFTGAIATAVCSRLQPVYVKGVFCITNEPLLVNPAGGDYTLSSASPCINAGTNLAWMTTLTNDLAGSSRIQGGRPDMGPYEFNLDRLSVAFQPDVVQGFDPLSVTFAATLSGLYTNNLYYRWSFTNGVAISREGYDLRVVTNTYPAGSYSASLMVSNAQGETAAYAYPGSFKAAPPVVYVANAGWNTSAYPYTNWASAASNIQLAVNVGVPGTLAWVTDGVYAVSTAVTNPWGVAVRSVNGRAATTISGGGVSNCYSSAHIASALDGFTIRNGGGGSVYGGGAYLQAGSLLNCLVVSNAAARGGGVYLNSPDTLVSNCVVCGNSASTSYGGGISAVDYAGGLIVDCIITNNTSGFCGGVYLNGGRMRNCLVARNASGPSAVYVLGGGVTILGVDSKVESCTIASNSIPSVNGSAGGIYMGPLVELNNSIVYGNSNSVNPNYAGGSNAWFNDVAPAWAGFGGGNISADPLFVNPPAGDYRLRSDSPCVNAGTNLAWMAGAKDLGGFSRLVKGRVDMGAFERQPEPGTLIMVK